MKLVPLAHLAATLFMVGVIWFVQVVHYPLFAKVGSEGFALYSKAHSRLTSYVVGPPMLLEAVGTPSCWSSTGPRLCLSSRPSRGLLVPWMVARVVG